MQSYLTLWHAERVAQVQPAIHVRIGEGDEVFVFAGRENEWKYEFQSIGIWYPNHTGWALVQNADQRQVIFQERHLWP